MENLRRSLAMLPPKHPGAMDSDNALAVLDLLIDALHRLEAVRRVVDAERPQH